MRMMIDTAKASDATQFVLITPQAMGTISWGPEVRSTCSPLDSVLVDRTEPLPSFSGSREQTSRSRLVPRPLIQVSSNFSDLLLIPTVRGQGADPKTPPLA